MSKPQWENEHAGSSNIIKGTDEELDDFRKQFQKLMNIDIRDFIHIEFVENETKNFAAQKKALSYLKNCLEIPPTSVEDPTAYPEFHPELLNQHYEIPPLEEFTKNKLQLSFFQTAFLIECFCPNLPNLEYCSIQKAFMKTKTIYTLLLIAPLPVAIEYEPSTNSCFFTFADISIASADLIRDQVKFALGIFLAKSVTAYFKSVDVTKMKLKRIQKISEKLGFAIIRTQDSENYDISGSFCLYILPNQFGQEPRTKIQHALENEFQQIQLYQCEKCKKLFLLGSKESCIIPDMETNDEDTEMVFLKHKPQDYSISMFQFLVQ